MQLGHVPVLHLILPVHLPDHQLGVHDELRLVGAKLDRLADPGDQSPVLGVVVGVDAEELRVLVNDLPGRDHHDGVGGRSRVPPGAAVRVHGDLQ